MKSAPLPHDIEWGQRLDEWWDGVATPSEAMAVEAHVASCNECQQYLEALEHIDAALSSTINVPSPSTGFDLKIWSALDSNDEIRRALAKQRAHEDMQQQLAALNAGWRRKLALMIPGVLAGIAMAFWFVGLVNGFPVVANFTAQLQEHLGPSTGQLVQAMVTAFLGAGAGFAMFRWVVPSAD